MQGAVEELATSQTSINEKMPAMLLVILLLLMVQLQHFGKTLMVLATGPLGLIGAATALLRVPGAVRVRRDPRRHRSRRHHHAQQRDPGRPDPAGLAAGHDAFYAIVESAVRRFRPITLTAAAAVLALIPLAREVFWAPMALAMMGGLIAATVLTLTFLPALYALAFRVAVPKDSKRQSVDKSDMKATVGTALHAV